MRIIINYHPPFRSTLLLLCTFLCCGFHSTANPLSVKEWANDLSAHLQAMFETATKHKEIVRIYEKLASAEVFQPHAELRVAKRQIEAYLRDRAKMAWDAKVSLESREVRNVSDDAVNDPNSADFVRYLDAKTEGDGAVVYQDGHLGHTVYVNRSREYELKPNVNFYGIRTSSESSSVHIPTPVYKRNPYALKRIEWSNIDQVYRRNRERMKDLSFQKFCSESGFMRYFPAAPWRWDAEGLDLFDCRATEWFIDGATMSKNVLIMLDLSGSMLGQRYEIAKQTIEAILETLYDNDFFNVLAFSKNAQFLDDCASDTLIQATMRNKKLIWSKLSNVTAEGKAEYEKALAKAFTTLMNLKPSQLEWKTKEEIEKEKDEGGGLDPQKEYIHLNEHYLVVDRSYIDAINNFSGNTKMGCNDVIMLVTDGAPDFYKDVFELYNKHKQVRFFSFLVGEEATDFEQVRWMACNNRGFMVHISNLADILEKIQHYVRVLSRPISHQATNINQESAVWSSIARERMSNEFVISVGYPVIVDEAIMGVAAVSIPLIEVQQIAHPSYVGAQSYYFMLDNNGYTMFHPQLDQFDSVTNEVKPIFNNLDFSEVEITPPMHKKPKPGYINCDDNTPKELTVMFSTEDIRRVYIQKNSYHSECIDGTQFTLGLAVSEGDEVRLHRKGMIDWNSVDLEWMRGKNWRIHPKWRYCLLNDSDTHLGPEAAFQVYAKHMRDYGELPLLCRARRRLIDRLLLDMQATTDFNQLWDEEWTKNKESGIHLTFFSTPSGLIRFANQSLEELAYEKPMDEQTVKTYGYQHFVLQQNKNSVEDEYFKRAVRQKGKIVFDVNRGSHLWYKKTEQTFFGHKENVSLLGVAYKAVYTNDALIGVAGVEFLYDKLAERMKEFGCKPDDETQRCFLIDEHAYVLYSSQKETEYTNVVKNETRKSTKTVIGSFFGHLNRVTEWTMEVLIKKGFFAESTYWDNQAMCDKVEATTASSFKLTTITRQFVTFLKYFYRHALNLLSAISQSPTTALSTFFAVQPRKVEAFTTTFKPSIGRLPCRTKSKFYLANTDRKGTATAALLEENYAERPCKQNAAQCAVKVYASWVENTNLLMVVIKQGQRSSCYDDKHCPLAKTVPFGFERLTPSEMKQREKQRLGSGELDDDDEGPRSQCPSTKPHHRKTVAQCLREPPKLKEFDPELRPCSITSTTIISSALCVGALFLLRL